MNAGSNVPPSAPHANDPAPTKITNVVETGAASQVELRRFGLEFVEGPRSGEVVHGASDQMVIGRHRSADLVIDNDRVSHFHCRISLGSALTIRDLGSTNGTDVDGVRVIEAHLRPGSLVTLGRIKLRVRLGGDSEVVAVPLSNHERFGHLVGCSVAMRTLFARLERAAPTNATVLLEGETGTGKELTAEAIHRASARRDGPFVVVDCGAIAGDLIESELFGHERGAFTGAVESRPGAFEEADGGTLFLDEVGDLPPELQPRLLRALERREVKRVGGRGYRSVGVRVIAATNRDLREMVNQRLFRADLFYRLAVVQLRMPPLREHREDIPVLVEHLLAAMGAATQPIPVALATFLARAAGHTWPGNVRELRNAVESCMTMLELPDAGRAGHEAPGPAIDLDKPLVVVRAAAERAYLEALMLHHAGNTSAAARAAGVHRSHLSRLLAQHGLRVVGGARSSR